ncbi:MAG: mycothiol synthase [Jatrophihabitantaceae bacterium]
MPPTLDTPTVPDDATLAAIHALIATIAAGDGRDPLSDQALSHLTSPAVDHAIARDGARVVGYAQLDGRSLEIAAEPGAAGELLDAFAGVPVLIWSHGRRSRLRGMLADRGFVAERELYQLRRSLADPADAPDAPEGVAIRPFVVGKDEDAWLAVNRAAFAHHHEQGAWTRADLAAREGESWFDPSGFLMAWRGDDLLGFHWTKIHPDGAGEVYVLGVDTSAQGLGLGDVLLRRGLAHLRARGCPDVLLFVDGDNAGAMRLYERAGFERHDLDVQWAAGADAPDGQSSEGSVSNT